jgi:lipoprotein-anchoring transpeptidase ErfK/SrfK
VPKKTARKKHLTRNNAGYYLKIYFLSVFSGLAVFLTGTFILNTQEPCANSKTCQSDLVEHIENKAPATFQGHTIIPPEIDVSKDIPGAVLGENVAAGEKHIYVDLSTQKLHAYQGTEKVMETFISSGKWNRTPVGNYNVWLRLRATRMSGGSGADYYNLPNVPYTMFFYGDYGIHGAYWHNNFGHAMSHGCVNMRIVDARDLYNWAEGPSAGKKGTPVSVCNSFTGPNNCEQNKSI